MMELHSDTLAGVLEKTDILAKEAILENLTQAKSKDIPLEIFLVDADVIKDEQLGVAVAEYHYSVPYVDLGNTKIDDAVLAIVPEVVARARGVIAFDRGSDALKLAMRNPHDLEIRHLIEKRAGVAVRPYYVTHYDFIAAVERYKASLTVSFERILGHLKDPMISREERDDSIVELIDMLVQYGYLNKSSDIHISPMNHKVAIRFRIDGVLHDVLEIPKELLEPMVMRIKILSKMRTDEHRAAQDGKFRFDAKEEIIDVRVSVVPVTYGENVVMRLLSSKSRRLSLTDLGLQKPDFEKVNRASDSPHGMLLVTGPTGSGKTTTVYAILKILNTRDVHIASIEDPVEYDIEGATQIQVNPGTGLTFAKGLRSIVRQDPDIIMVGEIRDGETAGIAVNSAMTGHIVLSTLHANDSATTFPRLLDMGVEPYLVASTVNVVIAQRLVRKICEKCKASGLLTEDEWAIIDHEPSVKRFFESRGYTKKKPPRAYKGKGCVVCANTGYTGRLGIFEVLVMEPEIKKLIITRSTSDVIMDAAKKGGMTSMLEDGLEKILLGHTTLEEVLRATKE
ncbi:Flp pilus assembly complex ATPase component TadA [Candidatus Uhrbacteria bacterium]|nr:Flp pilus assembly complex ATPase component TadA [Candidatus Uhrbacteria bacterium]